MVNTNGLPLTGKILSALYSIDNGCQKFLSKNTPTRAPNFAKFSKGPCPQTSLHGVGKSTDAPQAAIHFATLHCNPQPDCKHQWKTGQGKTSRPSSEALHSVSIRHTVELCSTLTAIACIVYLGFYTYTLESLC